MSNNSRDTIFIGKKPLMTYVTAAIIQLATQPAVTIKARGLTTAIAIDVAQSVLSKTKPAFEIESVNSVQSLWYLLMAEIVMFQQLIFVSKGQLPKGY